MEQNSKTGKLASFFRRHRVGLLIGAILLVLVFALVIWLRMPPAVPDRPTDSGGQSGQTGGQPDVPSTDGSGGTGTDNPAAEKVRKDNFYTFVLAGTNDSYNTDTIMLGSIDVTSGKINILSVPRDTMVDIPNKIKRLNGAYGRAGCEELCRELEELTGVYPDFYCVVNMKAFTKIVNLVGGVEFYVPYDMYHAEEDYQYTIDLKKGWQVLDGNHALQLVRYRGTSQNDFGRTQLQRDFLTALLQQVTRSFSVSTVSGIIDAVMGNLKTNMSAKDALWFYTNVISGMDLSQDLIMESLPYADAGRYQGQDYVYLDAEAVAAKVSEAINPYTSDITPEDLHIVNLKDQDY